MLAILVLIFSFIYVEFLWNLVETKKRPYERISGFLKLMAWLNFGLAILFHSYGSLIFGAICSLYQMVIFEERKKDLK
jgi:hypothetical protein